MQRKIHNQTLFVAALSVYLGLVLVGAPPQVLAQVSQSPFTQEALKDERVKALYEKDDNFRRILSCTAITPRIIKKGSSENLEENYSIEDFTSILSDLAQFSYCMSPENYGIQGEIGYTNSPQYLTWTRIGPKSDAKNHWGGGILSIYGESLGNSLPHLREFGKTYFQIDFTLNSNNLSSTAKFEQGSIDQAQQVANSFQISLFNAQAANKNNPEAILLENTKISFERNQVFIVTRLPRAGLNALLKANEKAN